MDRARQSQIKGVRRAVKVISALRERLSDARSAGRSLHIENAFEYTILRDALDLYRDTLSATTALRNSESP